MDGLHIAIAGAGIAGLTTALLLSRAGFRVSLFERNESLGEVGAGLQISPNAGRILDNLGLAPALDRVATRPQAIDLRAAQSGRIIVSLPLGRAAARYGAPYRLVHRADLHQILADAAIADPSIDLKLGAPISAIRAHGDRIDFGVAHGASDADLLIGADGVRSAVRQFVAGPSVPQPSGRTAWRTTLPADAAPEELPRDRTTVFLGDRVHVVVYPVRSGREINIVAIVEEDWQSDGWSEPGDRATLQARFRSTASLLQETIASGIEWTRWCLSAVDPAGPWSKGRAVLVGDAAHAMLPFLAQGAAMAIEDAAILSRTLSRGGLSIEAALARYQALRQPRVTRVWQAARQSGGIYHMSPLMTPFRDTTMKALGGERLLARYDWIYRWRQSD